VVQYEDRSLIRRKPAKSPLQQVAVEYRQQLIRCGRSVCREDTQVGDAAPFACRFSQAGVDEEAAEPRVEAFRVAQRPQVPPGDHERVLDDVLSSIDVAEDAMRNAEEAIRPVP
jgi:hypothetical protein